MANEKIRDAASRYGVHLWQVADALGIVDSTLSRKLRKELPAEEQQRILNIITSIYKNGGT